jgi:hypothetical protein
MRDRAARRDPWRRRSGTDARKATGNRFPGAARSRTVFVRFRRGAAGEADAERAEQRGEAGGEDQRVIARGLDQRGAGEGGEGGRGQIGQGQPPEMRPNPCGPSNSTVAAGRRMLVTP